MSAKERADPCQQENHQSGQLAGKQAKEQCYRQVFACVPVVRTGVIAEILNNAMEIATSIVNGERHGIDQIGHHPYSKCTDLADQ